MKMSGGIHRFQEILYDYITFFSFFLYIVVLFGLSVSAPQYLKLLDNAIKLYVCLFLIIRFNPFRKYIEFTALDRKVIFTSGIFILASTFLGTFLPDFIRHIADVL